MHLTHIFHVMFAQSENDLFLALRYTLTASTHMQGWQTTHSDNVPWILTKAATATAKIAVQNVISVKNQLNFWSTISFSRSELLSFLASLLTTASCSNTFVLFFLFFLSSVCLFLCVHSLDLCTRSRRMGADNQQYNERRTHTYTSKNNVNKTGNLLLLESRVDCFWILI